MFQMLNQGKVNPMEILKQMNNKAPQQMQNLITQAQNMGFPSDVLNQIQNELGINAK